MVGGISLIWAIPIYALHQESKPTTLMFFSP